MDKEFVNVVIGHRSKEEVANIAREIRALWRFTGDIRPNGDRHKCAQLKVTRDSFGQYHIYLNHQALALMLLSVRKITELLPIGKQSTTSAETPCPPEVPECLRWGEPSCSGPDSKPE